MHHTSIKVTLRQYRVHRWRLCYIWERASQCELIVAFCRVVLKHRQVYYWQWFRFRRSRCWLSVWITWLFVVRLCMLEEHSSSNCNSVEGTVGSYWRKDLCFLWKGSVGWLPGPFCGYYGESTPLSVGCSRYGGFFQVSFCVVGCLMLVPLLLQTSRSGEDLEGEKEFASKIVCLLKGWR